MIYYCTLSLSIIMSSEDLVEQATALDDIDVAHYLVANCRPDDGYGFRFKKLPEFSQEEKEALGRKISDESKKLDEILKSRPLSFTRINQELARSATVPDSSLIAQTTNTATEDQSIEKRIEVEWYNCLIELGGRPVYPITAIHEVWRNVKKYEGLFLPWLGRANSTPYERQFFWQTWTWRNFCEWRYDKRGAYNKDAQFSLYVELGKRHLLLDTGREEYNVSPSTVMPYFEEEEAARRSIQRDLIKGHIDGDFPGYVKAMTKCLEDHGFKRPFQLKKDPEQQDQITTWIEYLGYEYFWYDKTLSLLESLQPEYNEKWKALVDAKVVSRYETRESSELLQMKERIDRAARNAELEMMRLLPQLGSTSEESKKRVSEAWRRESLTATAKRFYFAREMMIKKFDEETRSYQDIKKYELKRREYLLRWIQEEIEQIELESKEKEAGETNSRKGESKGKGKEKAVKFSLSNESEAGPSRADSKRRRSDTDDSDDRELEGPSFKRSKTQHQHGSLEIQASTQASTRDPSPPRRRNLRGPARNSGQRTQDASTEVARSRGTAGNEQGNGQKATRRARGRTSKEGSSARAETSEVRVRRSARIASLPKPRYT
ncbi:hypothetical protein F4810DRAFT_666917 [Camillea tinctor]|nr:hypothetical protein F4810DRAFT_666917 [Camillea tinctor]